MKVRLGVRTIGTVSGTAAMEIRAAATPGRWKLMELKITLATAVASLFGLTRSSAIGATPTTPVNFIPSDPNDVIASGVLQSALAWGTQPTVPTDIPDRTIIAGVIGNGGIFTFAEGLVIPLSGSIVLWNLQLNAVADVTAVLEI